MPDQRSHTPSKITLEDLLRLKRSERPEPEFWADFERTLRQKQLAALVEKRSWWHHVAAAYGRFGRIGLPLGATAILAVTFLSVRYQFRMSPDGNVAAGDRPITQGASLVPLRQDDLRKPATVSAPSHLRAPEEAAFSSGEKSATMVAATAPRVSRQVVTPVSWLDDVLDDRASPADLTPSARSIAVNLATAAAVEPELVDAVSRPLGFEERAMPTTHLQHTAEILPTAAAVTEPRRARLLASLGSAGVYTPEPSAPEHARRSVLRYLAEDGWDRSMSRLEAEGDKLSIKF